MNAISQFLSTRMIIVGCFCLVSVINSFGLMVCLIWKIEPNHDVLANAKELTIAAMSALAVFLRPASATDAPPGGTAQTKTTTEVLTKSPDPSPSPAEPVQPKQP